MRRLAWTPENVCSGLIVLAVSAMSCAIVCSGILLLLTLR